MQWEGGTTLSATTASPKMTSVANDTCVEPITDSAMPAALVGIYTQHDFHHFTQRLNQLADASHCPMLPLACAGAPLTWLCWPFCDARNDQRLYREVLREVIEPENHRLSVQGLAWTMTTPVGEDGGLCLRKTLVISLHLSNLLRRRKWEQEPPLVESDMTTMLHPWKKILSSGGAALARRDRRRSGSMTGLVIAIRGNSNGRSHAGVSSLVLVSPSGRNPPEHVSMND
jgi:hypothetical protein